MCADQKVIDQHVAELANHLLSLSQGVCPKNVLRAMVIVSLEVESSCVVSIVVSQPLACISHVELMMALSMSDNESYASEKQEDFVFARGGCVLEPDDTQVFVQEEVFCSGRQE